MPIGAILAIASLAASAFGAAKSAQANKNADNQLKARQSELDAWYNKEYNTPYIDTDEGKSTINLLKTQLKDQMKKVDQNNAIQGASDEARVATADKLNTRFQEAVTRMAGYGTQRKAAIRNQYMGYGNQLDNLEYQNTLAKGQNWANFMGNAGNALGGATEAGGAGAFDKWDKSIKGWWDDVKKAKNYKPHTITV